MLLMKGLAHIVLPTSQPTWRLGKRRILLLLIGSVVSITTAIAQEASSPMQVCEIPATALSQELNVRQVTDVHLNPSSPCSFDFKGQDKEELVVDLRSHLQP